MSAGAVNTEESTGTNDSVSVAPQNETPETVLSGSCGETALWPLDPDTGVLTISGSGAMNDYKPSTAPW